MLAANKLALEKDLGVSMNELRHKEIEYLRSSFSILATASSVLVGFGYNNLTTSLEPQQQLAVDGTYSRLAVINWGQLNYNEVLLALTLTRSSSSSPTCISSCGLPCQCPLISSAFLSAC